ncbi:MAG TPA: UbiA family prenyltransferase [Pseudonocardiaceae bacterium]
MTRPAVAVLLATYAAIGLASTGHGEDHALLARILLVVFGFLLFSVACNDITDARIDAVNLAGDRRRPLVVGGANRIEMLAIGIVSAALALVVAATLGWFALAVVAAGLALSVGYSVRPVRVADRGALASLLLPACYVAVPFLVGHGPLHRPAGLVVLAGLYVGFIGRILLKDFRDVRGDALFGKRTFLVRHGRGPTCVFSAICLALGAVLLLAGVDHPTIALVGGYAAGTVAMVALLAALHTDRGPRRDELLISAVAIVGRGMLLLLLAHQELVTAAWAPWAYDGVLAALIALTAAQAVIMLRHGPASRWAMAPQRTGVTANRSG